MRYLLTLQFLFLVLIVKAQMSKSEQIDLHVRWIQDGLNKNASDIYIPCESCPLLVGKKIYDIQPDTKCTFDRTTGMLSITQTVTAGDTELSDAELLGMSYLIYPSAGLYYLNPEVRVRVPVYTLKETVSLFRIDTAGIVVDSVGDIRIPVKGGSSEVSYNLNGEAKIYVVKKDTMSHADYDFMSYRLASTYLELTDDMISACNNSLSFQRSDYRNFIKLSVTNTDNFRKRFIRTLKTLYKLCILKA